VVVLPPAIAAEVLAEAREQERQEEFIAGRVALGEPLDGLHPLSDARRPDYEAWLAQQPSRKPPTPQADPPQPPPTPHTDPPQPPPKPHTDPPQPPPTPHTGPQRCDIDAVITATTSHRVGEQDPSHDVGDAP
jgi:hypothetical protein